MAVAQGSILALAALGAFHGVNPAMGWLFAVGRGMQEGSRALLLQSLPSIAAGHAGSVGLIAVAITVTGSVTTANVVAIGGGVLLVGFGLWRLLSQRHFRWSGMRLSLWQLAGWSFLMSSAHGAGLMLLPVLTAGMPGGAAGESSTGTDSGHAHGPGHGAADGAAAGADAGSAVLTGVFATGVHTLAMFLVAGVIAVLVYEFVGLRVLRYAWFNLDRLWAAALLAAGLLTLTTTLL